MANTKISAFTAETDVANITGFAAFKTVGGSSTNVKISGSEIESTLNLSNFAVGTLPVGRGGTGQTSYVDGELLIGNTTGNTLAKATLTQGTDLSITNGNGSISIGHATVGNTPASNSTTLSAGGTFTAINSVTVSAQGHLTGQNTETYTLPSGYNLPLAADGTRGGIQIGATGLGAKEYAVQLSSEKAYVAVPWVNTSYSTFTYDASDPANNSTSGLVPAPTTLGDNAKFLTGAATWATPTDTGVTGVTLALGTGATSPLAESITSRELTITSNKYGGTSQVGYVPEGGTASTFLRGDGTWVTPTNTQNTTGSANPSATISGSKIDGTANTFMRSDAVPALGSTITIGTAGTTRGIVSIEGGGGADAQLKLHCSAGSPQHAITIEGPQHSGGSNYIIKLPHGAPALNKILKVGTYAANAGTYADPSLATMIWADDTDTSIYAANGNLTADRTVTMNNVAGNAPYNLTFAGITTSKVTFSNLGGVEIARDLTVQKNVIIQGQGYSELHTGVTTATFDWNAGNVQSTTLGAGTVAFAPTNPKAGATYIISIAQTGAAVINWSSYVKWPSTGEPTLSGNAKTDVVTLICYDDSTTNGLYYGSATLGFTS